ncbi:hypothetical protein BN1095_2520002 [Clostridioides difficile]|uniref:Uncharacterized protein n=1 Tax=Clostridioides difficile TaxID=1496 RepID=A0A069AQK3_CLODI|nr:hypothetical protein BN1095_2520002 [Clostridioides difficile]
MVFYVSEERAGHQAVDGCRCGVCRLGLAGFRTWRHTGSVCGCGSVGVCVGSFGRMVAEKGFEPCDPLRCL